MPTPTEYWEVNYVQYVPNTETVQLAGAYVVVGASGKVVREYQNIMTTQAELQSKCPPGDTVWGDDEVAAVIAEKAGVPAQFPPAP